MKSFFSTRTKTLAIALVSLTLFANFTFAHYTQAQPQQTRVGHARKRGTFNWLREAPRHNGRVIRKLPQATPFEVVGVSGDYYAIVLTDGLQGWLHRDCIDLD